MKTPSCTLLTKHLAAAALLLLPCGGTIAEDRLTLSVVADPHPLIGTPMRLTASTQPIRSDRRFTFLVRHDEDSTWTVLEHRTASASVTYTPQRAGRMEVRVDAVSPSAEEMRSTARVVVQTGREGSRMTGRAPGSPRPFPDYHAAVKLVMEDVSVVLGQRTRIHIQLLEPRNSRRITVLERHESDSEWRVMMENPAALVFDWQPRRIGQYQLRVDVVGDRDDRDQVSAVCLDPRAPAGSRMRGR